MRNNVAAFCWWLAHVAFVAGLFYLALLGPVVVLDALRTTLGALFTHRLTDTWGFALTRWWLSHWSYLVITIAVGYGLLRLDELRHP